jgi:anionic cell wall polymer biosynthesis LytR-Cps2A-Psr (LCP) family protein
MNTIVFIVFGAAAIFIAYKSFQSFKEYQKNNSLPILSINAIVIDKMYKDNNPIPIHIQEDRIEDYKEQHKHVKIPDTFMVAFKNIDTNEEIHFDVKEDDYEKMRLEEEGLLSHQGTRFHQFFIK